MEVIVADADADADADVDESLVEYDELESEGDEDEEQAGDPNNLNEEDFSWFFMSHIMNDSYAWIDQLFINNRYTLN